LAVLRLVQTLLSALRPLLGGTAPTIGSGGPAGLTGSFAISVYQVPARVFLIRNAATHFGIDTPFRSTSSTEAALFPPLSIFRWRRP
jgi:hypothetical protein